MGPRGAVGDRQRTSCGQPHSSVTRSLRVRPQRSDGARRLCLTSAISMCWDAVATRYRSVSMSNSCSAVGAVCRRRSVPTSRRTVRNPFTDPNFPRRQDQNDASRRLIRRCADRQRWQLLERASATLQGRTAPGRRPAPALVQGKHTSGSRRRWCRPPTQIGRMTEVG